MIKTFIDENQYRRFKKNNKLVHRIIAFKYCKHHNGIDFQYCDVHHIDYNKENNHYKNLLILTRYEHMRIHENNISIKQILKDRIKHKIIVNKKWKNEKITCNRHKFKTKYDQLDYIIKNKVINKIILAENKAKQIKIIVNKIQNKENVFKTIIKKIFKLFVKL